MKTKMELINNYTEPITLGELDNGAKPNQIVVVRASNVPFSVLNASTDMLEALKEAIYNLENNYNQEFSESELAFLKKSKAAIAKAEGK